MPEQVLPAQVFLRTNRIEDAPELVTFNCVDQGKISATCRRIMDLRRLEHGFIEPELWPGNAG